MVKDQRFKKFMHGLLYRIQNIILSNICSLIHTTVPDCFNNNVVLISKSLDAKGVALSVFFYGKMNVVTSVAKS